MTETNDDSRRHDSRRAFLTGAGAGAVVLLSGCAGPSQANRRERDEGESEISASEDLMREHGVLHRLLLVYEASRAQLAGAAEFRAAPLHQAAGIVQRFIEQYHEKLEEDHVFPRFEKAGRLVELVSVLRQQHAAGRVLTQTVLEQTASGPASAHREALTRAIDAFVRMYRPHAAREDTVLFPALRQIASASELADLGERFEDVEHERFGEGGFDAVVTEVAEIERRLGIHDLAEFTPKG